MSKPDREREKTIADYIAGLIAPVLIMTLVGSLVYFLVEIVYVGQYGERLQWILGWFVFAAVLVSRMSMLEDTSDRAGLYGGVLGIATWIALAQYVEFPKDSPMAPFAYLINIGLLAIIWWSSHKLTLDCTLLEDKKDASGVGLLDEASMKEVEADLSKQIEVGDEERPRKRRRRHTKNPLISWWERYEEYREEQKKKPRTHGVWVVYFSLAALPLFGLGQSLIPATDSARRQYTFLLLCIYVASGLGLLLTTTFLSLRRYLRHRNLHMPLKVTSAWLIVGISVIAGLLVIGALLPRPHSEFALLPDVFKIGSPEREASRWAVKTDDEGAKKGEGPAGEGKEGENDQGGGKASGGTKGERKRNGNAKGDQRGSKGSGKGEKGKGSQQSGSGGKSDSRSGQKQDSDKKGDSTSQKGKKSSGEEQSSKNRSGSGSGGKRSDQGRGTEKRESNETQSSQPWAMPQWLNSLSAFLKWVVLIIVAIIVAFIIFRSFLKFLANFTNWAQRLLEWLNRLQSLFARRETPEMDSNELFEEPIRYRPFSSYRDPFLTGRATKLSPKELVRYSFEALQAWAREHELGRRTAETPMEFARRLGDEFPALDADSRRLANYYAMAAYAPGLLNDSCLNDVRQFWEKLRDAAERPMSAGAAVE